MKNNFLKICITFSSLLLLSSCEKEENKIYYEGGTAPTLTASSTAALVLTDATKNNTAVKFSWTNPNYNFTTGLSSQNVTYTLQVDTAGANFTNPAMQQVSIANDLSITYTGKDLNGILTKLNLTENIPHNVEFRIISSLTNNSVPLVSNVIKIVITPYLDVAVPVPTAGTLWVTGDAFASGWGNPLPSPYDVNQKFTKVSTTLYELVVNMNASGAYKLIQTQGNWATQYHMVTGGTASSGTFEYGDANPAFPAPSVAGSYKLTFNFKTGNYTVVKQ
ncbi:MAG TPA: SusE domain-containing protein [Chitinophagaceae bacterium]|nr:SusE domain-containing protein [Chitinophagaceae bacterium]